MRRQALLVYLWVAEYRAKSS